MKVRLSAGNSAALRAHADIDTESPEGSHVTQIRIEKKASFYSRIRKKSQAFLFQKLNFSTEAWISLSCSSPVQRSASNGASIVVSLV